MTAALTQSANVFRESHFAWCEYHGGGNQATGLETFISPVTL